MDKAAPKPSIATGTCPKCGKPMTLFDDTWAHSSIFDFFVCAEVKAVPGGPATISSEDVAARMAAQSREALRTKDWGTT